MASTRNGATIAPMKYVIVIPDGAADEPQADLGDRTPLQAARLPNTDRIAQAGVVGRMNNVPRPLTPASDVATLSLFGYDPHQVYTGRAPLEATALGVTLGPDDWAIRCNLVHIADGQMRDFTAGHISSEEGKQLIASLQGVVSATSVADQQGQVYGRFELSPGVSARNPLVYRGGGPRSVFGDDTRTQPPHDVPDKPIADYLPSGTGAGLLQRLMANSRDVFADHPVNVARRAAGKRDATQVWLWGQGRA